MKITSSISIASLLMAFGVSTAQAANMPAELLGTYVSDSANCAQVQKSYKQTGMFDGAIVGKGGTSFIESSCEAKRVSKTADGAYSVFMKCSGEGEEWEFTGTYKISGPVLTIASKDGSERFKRCGK